MYLRQTSRREVSATQPASQYIILGLSVVVILMIVCGMWLTAGPSLRKPFVMDEMEFPAVARAIKETGIPNYYRGETNPSNQGLWHPPLYILSLAVWQLIFGSSVLSNRAFGLVNACLALLIVGSFAVRRWGWHSGSWRNDLALLPALLVGLSAAATAPLYIQGAILPDIDTQVLPLLITAFFVLLFELRRHTSNRLYWCGFVLALAVLFFAKLTTPVLLIPAFMVFELIRSLMGPQLESQAHHSPRSAAKNAPSVPASRQRILLSFHPASPRSTMAVFLPIFAGAASLALMIGFWFILAQAWGVNFRLPFIYLTQSSNNPASLGTSTQAIVSAIVASMSEHFRYFAQWVGYPFLILIGLLIVREFLRPADGILFAWERSALYTFIILLICMYIVLKPAPFEFPKYYPPLIAPSALLIIDLLAALHKEKRLGFAFTVLVGEILLYFIYILSSSTLRYEDFIYQIYTTWPKTPVFMSWMIVPLAFVMAANAVLWLCVKRRLGAPLIIAALAVTLGWQISTAARQMMVPYATTYLYGEHSLTTTTDYLRAHLPENAMLIAPKDIGYTLEDRWRYIELDVDPRPYLARPSVNYLVYRSNDYYGHALQETPEVNAAVQQDFEVAATIDNFVVMRRKALVARN